MAQIEATRSVTVISGTAISKYRFLIIAADGAVDHAGSAQGYVDGVSGMEIVTADIGDSLPMNLMDGAIMKVELGATVSAGDLMATDTVGRAIVWVDAAGNVCIGKILAAGVLGDVVSCQCIHKQTGGGS